MREFVFFNLPPDWTITGATAVTRPPADGFLYSVSSSLLLKTKGKRLLTTIKHEELAAIVCS